MNKNKFCYYLILIGAIFVAFGDLRNLITPIGYWLLWSIWFFLSLLYLSITRQLKQAINQLGVKIFLIGIFILVLGFFVSSLTNNDGQTLYQGVKLIAISAIGYFIFQLSTKISSEYVVKICYIVLFSSFAAFIATKLLFSDFQIILGDGRRGSIMAYPGVLWKAGCFFSIFALARFLESKKLSAVALAVYIIGAFLVISDGSRTGLLWFLFSSFVMFGVRFVNFQQKYSVYSLLFYPALLVFFVLIGLTYYSDKITADLIVPLDRLSEFDSARHYMIISGINNAEACLPFGCGFGSSISSVHNMVVHNSYLAVLGDVGVIGLIGLMIILLSPFVVYFSSYVRPSDVELKKVHYYKLAAVLGLAGFSFSKIFHPLSTEMSEWGYYFLLFAFLYSRNANEKIKNV